MNINNFSLDDFKDWMKTNGGSCPINITRKIIGSIAKPRLSSERLISKISLEEGDLYEVARDFRKGGKVIGMDENNLLIEVNSGTFYIPRQFVVLL